FKFDEISMITQACPNLTEFRVALLHLADTSALSNSRGDPNDEGFAQEDAKFSVSTLIEIFFGLPVLEELVLDVCNNVRDIDVA
ncbi:F-box/LRR-repeat MAX2 A, partial [Datura stramonium]|nr:F-box/LRR-repeat MAX2 A [Datura stramonium]